MITLYNGNEKIKLEVNDESYSYESIMGELSLNIYFDYPGYLEVPVGSWCDFYGKRYYLKKDSNFKKNAERNFKYTLILETSKADAMLWKVRNTVDNRIKFPYTAKPEEHLRMLVENLNRRSIGWKVGDCIEGTEKFINYSHTYILDGLNQLASLYETEWQITEETVNGKQIKTVHLKKVEYNKENPLKLSYGKGNGFKTGVGRESGDIPPEIILVETTDRNIDFSTYNAKNLLLPKSQTLSYEGKLYMTDADGISVMRADRSLTTGKEDSFDCTEIYPSRTGEVSQVIEVDAEKNFYDFVDKDIPESLNFEDCLIVGDNMTVIFQSGMLAGKEFEVKYNHKAKDKKEARRFEIVPQEIDGITMPAHDVWKPQFGDKYAVFGIQLPDSYICDNETKTGASWEVFKEAAKYLYEHEDKKFTFTGTLDGIWAKKRWLQVGGKIVLGGYVDFYDIQFHPEGSLIRMIGIKRYVNNPYSPEIELSNEPVGTSVSSELNQIETNEVTVIEKHKDALQFSKRRFRDAKETMKMLEDALLNFSGAINPIAVQTMQLLVGDESLQFRFVNSMTVPVQVEHVIKYDTSTKILNVPEGVIQHMTLGITSVSSSHKTDEYKFWLMPEYNSPKLLDAGVKYYLYAKVSTSDKTGAFFLSEKAIKLEQISGYYHLLVGVLNSEQDGERSFVELYGFTEVLPGRITTDRIVSSDGLNFMDFVNNAFRVGNDKNYFDWNSKADGKLRLKGTIVQSESGDESPVGCFRGVYNNTYTYYWGDEVTFTISDVTSTYRYINQIPSKGKLPTDGVYWIIVAEGTKGEDGATGDYFEHRYAVNGSRTAPPSLVKTDTIPSGWSTSIPSMVLLQYLWMTISKKKASGELLQNWSTPVRQTPYDGIDGVDGKNAPSSVFRGIYKPNTVYYGTPIRVDIVKYNTHYYIARTDAGDGFIGKTPDNTNYWNSFGAEFESIATGLLLAENANIANFIFKNQRMVSQTVNSDGIPNLELDGMNGFIRMLSGEIGRFKVKFGDIIGYNKEGVECSRFSSDPIPVVSSLYGDWEVIKYGDEYSETDDFYRDDESGRYNDHGTYSCEFSFYVGYPCTIRIGAQGGSYSFSSRPPGTTIKDSNVIRIYKDGALVDSGSINDLFNILSEGTYTVSWTYSLTLEGMPDRTGVNVTINMDYQGIEAKTAIQRTMIGSDGLYSIFSGGEYMYFKNNYGFEVKAGNYGLQISKSGIKRWNGTNWVGINL